MPGIEDRRLALEAEDRAVDVGLAEQHAGVVRQIARREIVGSVHHHVVAAKEFHRVRRVETQTVGLDLDVGVHRTQPGRGDLHLGRPDVDRGVEHLALQVGGVDDVVVDEAEPAHPGGGEVLGKRRTESARAEQQHRGFEHLALPFHPELREVQMASVAVELVGPQRRRRTHPSLLPARIGFVPEG